MTVIFIVQEKINKKVGCSCRPCLTLIHSSLCKRARRGSCRLLSIRVSWMASCVPLSIRPHLHALTEVITLGQIIKRRHCKIKQTYTGSRQAANRDRHRQTETEPEKETQIKGCLASVALGRNAHTMCANVAGAA